MGELLTTRQLQELLKVDRVTVYRMVNDGRLKGVKIGNQWRFNRSDVNSLMGMEIDEPVLENTENPIRDFPIDCIQRVQEIFAGIIGIGAMTVTLNGEVLTQPTFANSFCKLMLSNPGGLRACQNSWRKIAQHAGGQPPFQVCHAGLCYLRAMITDMDQPVSWLIAGQYYLNAPIPEVEQERLHKISAEYNIPFNQLANAVKKVPVLKKHQQEQVMEWTPKVAGTVHAILCERAGLMDRLKRIAELSSFSSPLD